MKNLKYCRVGSAYRILPTTSGFCVRTAQRQIPTEGNPPAVLAPLRVFKNLRRSPI